MNLSLFLPLQSSVEDQNLCAGTPREEKAFPLGGDARRDVILLILLHLRHYELSAIHTTQLTRSDRGGGWGGGRPLFRAPLSGWTRRLLASRWNFPLWSPSLWAAGLRDTRTFWSWSPDPDIRARDIQPNGDNTHDFTWCHLVWGNTGFLFWGEKRS